MKSHVVALARLVAWALAGSITVLTIVPPSLRPETPAPHNVEHFMAFAMAGFAFGVGYSSGLRPLLTSLLAFAGSLELIQTVIPGRHARVGDFLVDAVAVCLGSALGAIFSRRLLQVTS